MRPCSYPIVSSGAQQPLAITSSLICSSIVLHRFRKKTSGVAAIFSNDPILPGPGAWAKLYDTMVIHIWHVHHSLFKQE